MPAPAPSNFVIAIDMAARDSAQQQDTITISSESSPTPTAGTPNATTRSTRATTAAAAARTTPASRRQELAASPFALRSSPRRRRGVEQVDMTGPSPVRVGRGAGRASSVVVISDEEDVESPTTRASEEVRQTSPPRNETSRRIPATASTSAAPTTSSYALPRPRDPYALDIVEWDPEDDYDDADRPYDSDYTTVYSSSEEDDADIYVRPRPEAGRAPPPPRIRTRAELHRLNRDASRVERERAKLEKQHPFVKSMWADLAQVPVISPVAGAQPAGITRSLKPFQLEGVDWMRKQEASRWRGGLLGDEMGMGKTIQAVALVMSDFPAGRPSLVVVPPVALMQWQSEIRSYTDDKLKVLIHHNSSTKTKLLSHDDLAGYDVIIISYSGLESLYRKQTKGWNRVNGVVKEDSPIHALHYHRLILDEAHNIKQRTTSVAKACFALKANYKWCLSGTPVQNRIGEFFSLLRFLGVRPFACYLCKNCDCQTLQWSQDKKKRCTECFHSGFSHVSLFNQEILNPLTHAENSEARHAAFDKLRLITDRVMLRRVKKDHTQSMELPPKKIILHRQFFGEVERDFSTSIMTNSTRQFETYVSRGAMLSNYANIFGLIMQMRQVANHPDLIVKKHADGAPGVMVCCICDEPAEEPIRSRCRHEFCRLCAREYVLSCQDYGEPDCPRCHIPLSIDLEQPECEPAVGVN